MTSFVVHPSTSAGAAPDASAETGATAAAGDERPGLAIVTNCLTPYRNHLHELIAAGIPELKLHTLVTHGDADFTWSSSPAPSTINAKYFGKKGDSPLAGTFHAPLAEWTKGRQLIDYIHKNNVCAVICNGHRYLSYLRLIGHCHRAGIPLFVNNDSNIRSERHLNPVQGWLKRRVYAWWLRRTAGVMPMGHLGEQFFLKYGADRRRFYRVPYTPDYDSFAQIDVDGLQRFRGRYGLDARRRIILFSGRLVPVKRVDLLIDAFARLAAQRPEWDLLIVGDGPLTAELRRSAEVLGPRVKWTGFLEQNELQLAYHAADVLALPSDREPWAVVVQEAMAAGLPVVASDVVGAAEELVTDGHGGRIFAKGNVEALWLALLEVTASEQIGSYKEGAREALAMWCAKIDPVSEVRRALADAVVLKGDDGDV